MRKNLGFFVGLLFIFGACSAPSSKEDKNIVQLKALSGDVKKEHAPDRRSRTWEVVFRADTTDKGVVYVAQGVTTQPEAKNALIAAAASKGISLLDSIRLLPDSALGDKVYGITFLSVNNIRNAPEHANEMDTQTLMGMPVRILEKRNGWLRICTPEGYISWVNSSIQEMTKEEADHWVKANKIIVTTHYTLFREQPSATSAVVRDGVWGCIAKADGEQGAYYKVVLPDGKSAYIPKADAQKFEEWLVKRNPTAANVVASAKQFMGFPYLWGGTSIKAVDCSGFVKSSFYLNGVIIPRDASQQVQAGEEIDIQNGLVLLQPADLIFFGRKATERSSERVTHVGLYIGNGKFIHASSSSGCVVINSLLPDAPDYTTTAQSLIRAKRYIHLIDKDKEIVSIAKHPWYL